MTVVRLGTCAFADQGLVGHWYPKGLPPASRLPWYAEVFDTVEVDAPYYALPSPEVVANWVRRTPDAFVFHVKAHASMTFHEEADRDLAFRAFRDALWPLEASGKLRGVLLQYHPRFVRSPEALDELARVRERLDPLVPLVEFRHRSWVEDGALDETLDLLRREGLAFVSLDTPPTTASNVVPSVAAATHPVAYVRFHGRNWKTWNVRGARSSAERFDWMYSREELAGWVEPLRRLAAEAREVYALFNNNNQDYAPRSAALLRDLLDEAGVEAAGGREPEPREPTLF